MKKKVLLTAPTGRAAQRMSEVIGVEAKTIHRLLEWEPQKGGFKKSSKSPLECNFIIVDECSMLDISLGASLLNASPDYAQILFIGDPDQLPSVGPGALLEDLLSSKKVTHFRLTKVFRQAAQSNIIRHAHEINRGIIPHIASPIHEPHIWNKSVDCLFIDSDEATQEQLKFMARAKNAINKTLSDGSSFLIKTENKITGKASKINNHISVEELYVSDFDQNDNELELQDYVLSIPPKFQYVDLEKLSATSSEIEELKQLFKRIHPWSSLHYGFTALDIIKRIYTKTIKEKLGKDCEIQILTPQVKGSLGANNLNTIIQNSVNPDREDRMQIKIGDKYYRKGDRVIQTRNNYDFNVFNGDIGKLEYIDPTDFSCKIKFGNQDKIVMYKKEDLSEISLAYAITIHKSQGSEFDSVIIPVTTQHFKMLHRNLIYTGLTRAKKMAILVGNRKALVLAIKNVDNKKRQTALGRLL
jgi:exodeoxyribonuclease V alpha subunit